MQRNSSNQLEKWICKQYKNVVKVGLYTLATAITNNERVLLGLWCGWFITFYWEKNCSVSERFDAEDHLYILGQQKKFEILCHLLLPRLCTFLTAVGIFGFIELIVCLWKKKKIYKICSELKVSFRNLYFVRIDQRLARRIWKEKWGDARIFWKLF